MNPRYVRVVVVAGVAATVGGLLIAVTGPGADATGEPGGLVRLLAIGGLLAGAYLLYDVTRSRTTDEPVPWSDAGPIVETPPEAYPDSPPLTGWQFAKTLSTATETARQQRQIEAGIAVVRVPLRETYLEAMEAGSVDRATAERELAAGTWTDDAHAAAVLSAEVPLPSRPPRQRIADWLFPGRAVRRLTRRAVDAVAREGADRIPPVVGQDAPRNVPVYRPSLASLRQEPGGEIRAPGGEIRGPDGELRGPSGEFRAPGGEIRTPGGEIQSPDWSRRAGAAGPERPDDAPGERATGRAEPASDEEVSST